MFYVLWIHDWGTFDVLFSNNSDNNVSVSSIINTQIVPSVVSTSPSLPSPSLPASLETFLEQGLFFICKSSTPYLLYPWCSNSRPPSRLTSSSSHGNTEMLGSSRTARKMKFRYMYSLLGRKSHHDWDEEQDRGSARQKVILTKRTKSRLDLTTSGERLPPGHTFSQTSFP